jgi:hypothetical protein
MSRESSKSLKIGLKFEWEIEPQERFAQNPPKFVSIRLASLTLPKHYQAGAPNGHKHFNPNLSPIENKLGIGLSPIKSRINFNRGVFSLFIG